MFILNGKRLQPGQPFTVGEGDEAIQYPSPNALTDDDRHLLGITEVPDPVRPDDRYHWVADTADGDFIAAPKELAPLKATAVAQVKDIARLMLTQTDWKVLRSLEGTPLDAPTEALRNSIRAASNTFEASINACTTVEQLAALTFTWPEPASSAVFEQK